MSKLIQFLVPKLSSMIQSGGKSSAMKPMLSIGVVLFLAMVCMPSGEQIYNVSIKGFLGVVFSVYLAFAIRAYYKILEKDPKLLQSEHYQLSMRQMDLAAQQLGRAPDYHIDDNASQDILLDGELETKASLGNAQERVEKRAHPSEPTYSEESK